MTREEARQVEQQLAKHYPGGSVEVTRVPGGVWIEARDKSGWTFLNVADGSPLLTLLGAYPDTEAGDLPTPPARPAVTGPRRRNETVSPWSLAAGLAGVPA